jgi:hypothetical protein
MRGNLPPFCLQKAWASTQSMVESDIAMNPEGSSEAASAAAGKDKSRQRDKTSGRDKMRFIKEPPGLWFAGSLWKRQNGPERSIPVRRFLEKYVSLRTIRPPKIELIFDSTRLVKNQALHCKKLNARLVSPFLNAPARGRAAGPAAPVAGTSGAAGSRVAAAIATKPVPKHPLRARKPKKDEGGSRGIASKHLSRRGAEKGSPPEWSAGGQ